MKRNVKKVTLMEMITVMVIIILLVTIIMPVIVKGREWAKNLQCRSNLKNIGQAITSYCNDSNDVPPTSNGGFINVGGNMYSWPHLLIDPYSDLYGKAIMSTPLNGIVKAPENMTKGYIPVPKLKRTSFYFGYKDSLFVHPADYSSILSCPSESIAWRNENAAAVFGRSANDTIFSWYASHYNIGPLLRLNALGTGYDTNTRSRSGRQKLAMVFDAPAHSGENATSITLGADNQYIYGRHFSRPMIVSPAWTSGIGYRYHGSGRANCLMQDGHMESWNWLEFFNTYKARGTYEVINSAANPFFTKNW